MPEAQRCHAPNRQGCSHLDWQPVGQHIAEGGTDPMHGHDRSKADIELALQTISVQLLSATAETGEDDARLAITSNSAAFHLDLLRASKSLRRPTSQTISTGHPHSSHPLNSARHSLPPRLKSR